MKLASSPCIRVCRIEDGVCVGCKRTLGQITNWSKMTLDEQIKIIEGIK